MDVSFIDNDTTHLRDAIEEAASDADGARVAVAFAKGSGLAATPALTRLVERGAEVRLLAGTDFQLTDLEAVERFDRPPSAARLYVHSEGEESRTFHPKVYAFRRKDRVTAIVGSSNLTGGGFGKNIEGNVVLHGSAHDSVIASILSFHDRMWDSGLAIPITGDFRDQYTRLQDRRRTVELALRGEAAYKRAQRTLRLAVAEAMAEFRARSGTRCWLLITSPENYLRCIGGRVWGDEDLQRIGQVQTGDIVFFYVKSPAKYLAAMCVVTRDTYEDHSIIWRDDPRIYPFRFTFDVLIQPPQPVPFTPLIERLDLFGRRFSKSWGTKVQASMKELTPHDCAVLREALAGAEEMGAAS